MIAIPTRSIENASFTIPVRLIPRRRSTRRFCESRRPTSGEKVRRSPPTFAKSMRCETRSVLSLFRTQRAAGRPPGRRNGQRRDERKSCCWGCAKSALVGAPVVASVAAPGVGEGARTGVGGSGRNRHFAAAWRRESRGLLFIARARCFIGDPTRSRAQYEARSGRRHR